MRIFLRKFLTKIISKKLQKDLKFFEYKNKRRLVNSLPSISEDKLIDILVNQLGVKEGDNLFIHASLDMINTQLTPLDILKMILNIVGKNGSISVPTFIKYSSEEWMMMRKEFNIRRTPSGMGIFSERVRRHKDASRSLHPTKSVSTIGEIAPFILDEHHLDIYQFGRKSPFYKLLNYDVKIIGLGASMSYLSMVHVVEDVYPLEYPLLVNNEKIFQKNVIDNDKNVSLIDTLVHNLSTIVRANPEKFVKKYMSKKRYIIYNHYITPFFIIDGKNLFDTLKTEMKAGNTIYD